MSKQGIYFDYDLKANDHITKDQTCPICETKLALRWTDFHGVAVCLICGAPFVAYHYDENNKLTSTNPKIDIDSKDISVLNALWKEKPDIKSFVPNAQLYLKGGS